MAEQECFRIMDVKNKSDRTPWGSIASRLVIAGLLTVLVLLFAGCGITGEPGGRAEGTKTPAEAFIGEMAAAVAEGVAEVREEIEREPLQPAPATPGAKTQKKPAAPPLVDVRFRDAVKKYVKSSWSTWPIGERMGGCLIANAGRMTRESRGAVIEHGIDEAFDKLSGVHLMSLKTVWNVCQW